MPQTKFDVASAALVMVGASPVTSFGGHAGDSIQNAEQIACTHLYDPIVRSMLEDHQWRFATKVDQISRLAKVPKSKWRYAYQAPIKAMRIQNIKYDGMGDGQEFDRFEDEIHCNPGESQTVYCTYLYYPDESEWPAYFTRCVHLELASQFAVTLAAKIDLAEALATQLDKKLRMAKSIDSQQQTAKKLRTKSRNSIIEKRRS